MRLEFDPILRKRLRKIAIIFLDKQACSQKKIFGLLFLYLLIQFQQTVHKRWAACNRFVVLVLVACPWQWRTVG
jgi:hypothetical protein